MANKNDYLLEYDKLYLRAQYENVVSSSPHCPYPPLDIDISIEKNNSTVKYHTIEIGMEDGPWSSDNDFNTLDKALEHFYNRDADSISFYFFKLLYIDPSKKFDYTKKLLEKLNSNQFYKIDKLNTDSFKSQLGIELKLMEDASQKGMQIIHLVKNQNTPNENKLFFVGKIGIEGNMITVKDENENIIYLTSSENVTVETEIINEKYYWYFKK